MRTILSSPVRRRWLGRFVLACGCAAGLAALPVATDGDKDGEIARLGEELDDVRARIVDRRAVNSRLRRDISALKNDSRAIERAARDQLGLVYPSELVVRIRGGGVQGP